MELRNARPSDYANVIGVINDWWGGRNMADMLPKLFFIHFQDTSYVIEEKGAIIGFLIGFVSQTYPDQAYIHFVGVHPDYRQQGIANRLYRTFFDCVQARQASRVRCVTSPVNKASIGFHLRMGFQIEPGDQTIDGVEVHDNYDGRGQARVLFEKILQS